MMAILNLMSIKKWKLKEQKFDDLEKQILYSLDLTGEEEKQKFFSPDYEKDLHDPLKILNMDKAADRILSAIDKNEKIILFGDYDADGICGTVVFYDFFKKIGFENFDTYIPDRHKEEYGLSLKVIDDFAEQGIGLVITIDCGITDFEEIKKANKKGIDVVVTDHHLQTNKLPPAVAIVDPKQNKDAYLFEMLCGAGVAFKTVKAILKKGNFNIVKGWSKWLLDVVCIATVADMVPLVGENRVLVHYGLKVLRKTQRPGLLSLFKKLKIKKENITEDDIAFFIAPRINVASRMEHASISFDLLITENSEEADWGANRLNQKNLERREIAGVIIEEIEKEIEGFSEIPEVLFFGNKDWVPGVLGVVANRIIEKYNKPIFLWGKDESGRVKGSARSDGSVNLVDLMTEADADKKLLIEYGGHALAAGLTIDEGNLDILKERLQKAFKRVKKEEIENVLWIDKEVDLKDVDWGFLKTVEKFSPFGIDNPKPVFLFKEQEVFNIKKLGKDGIHLELQFKKGSGFISAMWFFTPEEAHDIEKGDKVDLLANVERSTFKGYNELRLMVVDVKKL